MGFLFSTRRLTKEQQSVIQSCIDSGLSSRQTRICANPKLTPAQMEQLRLALLAGLPIREVKAMSDPGITPEDMCRMRNIYELAAEIQMDMNTLKKDIQSIRRNA